MSLEEQFVREMRVRAARRLPADFPSRVVRDARRLRQRSQRSRLTLITTALCVALAVAAHWLMTLHTNRDNLEQWSRAAQQTAALEETI
jgi:hypothetical protein